MVHHAPEMGGGNTTKGSRTVLNRLIVVQSTSAFPQMLVKNNCLKLQQKGIELDLEENFLILKATG